ncbi:hypothetical protein E2C01_003349 [Portunus trituberculatus]|uniref:Uncharacterized protein n=1 Tax=Portunus trituberculatus TaxID=210409 RepID=A0A5B7CMH9_PORTR|nr:hypothetical protein [Portunus trituberculatus]
MLRAEWGRQATPFTLAGPTPRSRPVILFSPRLQHQLRMHRESKSDSFLCKATVGIFSGYTAYPRPQLMATQPLLQEHHAERRK